MNWNNRVVNVDGTLMLAEVSYMGGKPIGYCEPCIVGDDMDELRRVVARLTEALDKPVLTFEKGEANE